jgi:chemotaxis protein CheD
MAHQITVGIADLKVSDDPEAVLITHGVGSCIAVAVHDPKRKLGGMLHFMMPLSMVSPEKAEHNPAMFGDTGIPLLFRSMYSLGSRKQDLVVKVIGGSLPATDDSLFKIGRRNYTVLRKVFWKNGVLITAEDVGGRMSRTVSLYLDSGRLVVKSQGANREL